MILNDLGKIAKDEWQRTEKVRKNVLVDEFVIMPNHLHGILIIDNKNIVKTNYHVETNCNLSLPQQQPNQKPLKHGTSKTIGSIVRGFKIGVSKYARKNTYIYDVWQSNYYDRIIRKEDELNRFRNYIVQNPKNWNEDKNNKENILM